MKKDVLGFHIKCSVSTMAAMEEEVPQTSPNPEPAEKILKKEVPKTSPPDVEKHIRSLPVSKNCRISKILSCIVYN